MVEKFIAVLIKKRRRRRRGGNERNYNKDINLISLNEIPIVTRFEAFYNPVPAHRPNIDPRKLNGNNFRFVDN